MEPQIRHINSLRLVAEAFNELSDYEKFVRLNKDYLDSLYDSCMEIAKKGGYRFATFRTFRYDDPDKEHLVEYFKKAGYKVELYEPGLIKGERFEPSEEDVKTNPYRYYTLILDWSV